MVVDFVPPDDANVWTVADYGCGTGATTAQSMGIAVKALRARNAAQPIQVVHSDQVTNDFNQLLRSVRDLRGANFAAAFR